MALAALSGTHLDWDRTGRPARWLPWAAVFIGLNLLDLFLTWCLIAGDRAPCYEANPLASAVLSRAGWVGLGVYKAACVGVVLALGGLLARWRPAAARRVFLIGCALVTLVVSYSLFLAVQGQAEQRELVAALDRLEVQEALFRDMQQYQAQLDRSAAEVARGRLSLPAAVDELRACLAAMQYDPLPSLRCLYGDLTDDACLAAQLVRQAGWLRFGSRALSAAALKRLSVEFTSAYSYTLPQFAANTFRGRGSEVRAPTHPGGPRHRDS